MRTDDLENYVRTHRDQFDSEAPSDKLWDRISSNIPSADDTDPLADYIQHNRELFDSQTPSLRSEGIVFSQLDHISKPVTPIFPLRAYRSIFRAITIAASVILLLTVGFIVGVKNSTLYTDTLIAKEMERIEPGIIETENYYQSQIAAQVANVSKITQDPQLLEDLDSMDEAMAQIRAQLLEVPRSQREDLINRLIQTYRMKLEILIQIQNRISPQAPPSHKDNENDI